MPCYSVRPLGFPEREHDWLRSILTIGRGLLRDEWRWVTEGLADVYLVAADSPAHWERYRAGFPPDRLVACGLPDLDLADARWRVKRDREYLPSLREVTGVLNGLAEEIKAGNATPATPVEANLSEVAEEPIPVPVGATAAGSPGLPVAGSREAFPRRLAQAAPVAARAVGNRIEATGPAPAAAGSLEGYAPEEYLVGVIREALADGVPRRLNAPDDGGSLLIEPDRGLYFVLADAVFPSPLLSATRREIEVQRLTREELTRATVDIEAQGVALNDLVFLSVLTGSQGRLWVGCRDDEAVRLRQWPNLKVLPRYVDKPLPHQAEYIRLAAFMSGNTADVRTVSEHTGVSLEKVVDFHNACAALDLLERGGGISVRQKPTNAGVRDLYQKIAKRLNG